MSTQEEVSLKQFIDYLSQYYDELDISQPYWHDVDVATLPIWQMWAQGVENAPLVVKRCFKSVEKYCEGRPIGTITRENITSAGIELPDYIIDKYQRKIIPEPQFSDLVRLCLLEKYGGTWVDATILMTGPLPKGILAQPFFAYRAVTTNIFSAHALISNYFISSKPNHIIIRNLKNALFRYWRAENTLLNYFVFHFLLYGLVHSHPVLTGLWFRCSQLSNALPSLLGDSLTQPFNKQFLDEWKKMSSVHKLTHKCPTVPPGSFLDVLEREPEKFEI